MVDIRINKNYDYRPYETEKFPFILEDFRNKNPYFHQLLFSGHLKGDHFDCLRQICSCLNLDCGTLKFEDAGTYLLDYEEKLLIRVSIDKNNWSEDKVRFFNVVFYGNEEDIKEKYSKLESISININTIEWLFTGMDGRVESIDMQIPESQPIYDEFYPYLNCSVDEYLKKYLDSDSNCLIMLGDPGTGKTSLIRYFINKFSMKQSMTYDEQLMQSDSLFINFLKSGKNLLILEDSDILMTSRLEGKNHVMNKLLNSSDGLLKNPKKKIIMTANISNIEEIDSALIRPGRCFDVIKTRPLNKQEIISACKVIGKEPPENLKEATLAELFNTLQSGNVHNKKNKIGFI